MAAPSATKNINLNFRSFERTAGTPWKVKQRDDKMITETRTKKSVIPKTTWFERYPKMTLFVFNFTIFVILILLTEFCMGAFMGLGNPIIYDTSPLYGFRPLPNQEVKRFRGTIIKTNNLGLRANEDWNKNEKSKILFLGDSVTYGGSRIANDELFSHLAAKDLDRYQSASAGVNAWGVENIYGLVVDSNFMPAEIYITTLIENDFYRGLTRLKGKIYWNRKPSSAMEELFHYGLFRMSKKRHPGWLKFASEDQRRAVLTRSVSRLKEMDEVLKARGFVHLLYIFHLRKNRYCIAPMRKLPNKQLWSASS